ncbi:MAG: leucine-rich repeat protein [Bacteroidales bacterium]|nr:leucine-rich repeat protein [Bacteroidales bacterium]
MKTSLAFLLTIVVMLSSCTSEPDYLCFEVPSGASISLKKRSAVYPDIQYSFDKEVWNNLDSIYVTENCRVYFKGINPDGINKDSFHSLHFCVSDTFKCSGNIMTLIDGVGEATSIPCDYCFTRLFKGCPLTTAPQLPATQLTEGCYESMFADCKCLTVAPELPATQLAENCYYSMFKGCSSLVVAPKLPATTLSGWCYQEMFWDCSSLTTPPQLPATNLAICCYRWMFSECANLTSAPDLPATSLSTACYNGMFFNCASLTTVPTLPANILAPWCYSNMFVGCSSLVTIPQIKATVLSKGCFTRMFIDCINLKNISVDFSYWGETLYYDFDGGTNCPFGTHSWLDNVALEGTFICPAALPEQRGQGFIPNGWKIERK